MTQINRAQFLRGDWSSKDKPKRPPWSVEESHFVTLCEGCKSCGDCVAACPEKILISGRGHFPVIDFKQGGCSFCEKCVEACPTGALKLTPSQQDDQINREKPWALKAMISDACLSTSGVECRSCGDACDAEAINFRLVAGGVAKPELDIEACTGCGDCIRVCPVEAISVETQREKDNE